VKSYFDAAVLKEEARSAENGPAPSWLAEILRVLAENPEGFPPEEDEERFVVEYIYPH